MELNLFISIALGCLVYVILFGNIDANPLKNTANNTKQYGTKLRQNISTPHTKVFDDHEVAEDRHNIRMFPKHKSPTTSGPTKLTKFIKDLVRPRAGEGGDETTKKDEAGGGDGGGGGGGAGGGGAVGGGGGSGGGGGKEADSAKTNGEWTVSVPRFKIDAMGNWVYNPWGVTYGKVWEDTRFNIHSLVTIPRIIVDKYPYVNYHPYEKELDKVCLAKSTIYNRPKVMDWIKIHRYYNPHKNRAIMMDLRRSLFRKGNPEECHTNNFIKFRDFHECMLRRHQRMEYLLPKYPIHQI
ncbi:uncharacterized protein LOC115759651 [Drosophila novamexicana]|uniref:uncharacterized protein LOC115759651 n=1 Tax=Drosophila novamexicana TaxID=47314 RepID=UPI0011E5AE2E|nr:uncharacterized protein LOC115759651 [Drosophila novamexicana]